MWIPSPRAGNISENRACQWESFWALHYSPWLALSPVFHVPGVEMSIGLDFIATLSKSWSCLVFIDGFFIFFLSHIWIWRLKGEFVKKLSWGLFPPDASAVSIKEGNLELFSHLFSFLLVCWMRDHFSSLNWLCT